MSIYVEVNAIKKHLQYNIFGDKMRPDYFINEMLKKVDYAILNTYLVDKQRKRKKRNKTT